MPELPEVETIKRGLGRLIPGKKVLAVECLDSPKSFPNSPGDAQAFLVGATIVGVARRAKMVIIELSSGYSLMVHLKMTGQLVFVSADTSERWGGGHPSDSFIHRLPDTTTRVVVSFADGSRLFFNDLRKFGWLKLCPTIEVANSDVMQRVGPEPLEDSFTAHEFVSRIRRRNGTTVKAAILDQSVLAGVGNIYADESLWAALIHPATRVRDVSDSQLTQLLDAIKQVMTLSIEKGGSTDKNYVDAEGKKGSYLTFANVFRREGQPCLRCGTTIEKIRVAGRGTHICPHCQMLQ